MGGLYDILESYRLQDPKFTYEGLYQDPRRDDTTYYDGDLKTYPYGLTDASGLQPLISSAFPQDYGVGSLFNPRVGRPEQSIYYNEPEPADPTSDFYQPLPGFINAPQNYYAPIQQTPSVPVQDFQFLKSAYEDDDEEQVEYLPGQEPKSFRDSATLQEYFQNRNPVTGIMNLLSKLPTPMNILRGGLESLQGFNQKLRATDFGQSKTLAEYFQRRRDRKAREESAERGAAKQAQAAARASAIAQEAANRDYARKGPEGDGGRGSRRGDADISDSQRGGFATDDTAGFF